MENVQQKLVYLSQLLELYCKKLFKIKYLCFHIKNTQKKFINNIMEARTNLDTLLKPRTFTCRGKFLVFAREN